MGHLTLEGDGLLTAMIIPTATPHVPATLRVPQDYPRIQAAVDAATDGDKVLVAPGTYYENIDFLGKAITVESETIPEETIIDAGGSGSVVTFALGEDRNSILRGFFLRGGINDIYGGGVRIRRASPVIEQNIIEYNSSISGGGGISVSSGSPLIQDNRIRNNTGGTGGIFVSGYGEAQIIDNIIENNTANYNGGGICLNSAGKPRVEGNIIRGNQAHLSGGGITIVYETEGVIVQNLIVDNHAWFGGGIHWNVSTGYGGPYVVSNTIVANEVTYFGSAIYATGNDAQSLLTNNTLVAGSGQAAIYCRDGSVLSPPIIHHNNVFNSSGAEYGGDCGDLTGVDGNISADPLFLNSGSDYHLGDGSPSIDAGDNQALEMLLTDFDGDARILDGDLDGYAVVDMGYDEFVPPEPTEVVIGEVGQITAALSHVPYTVTLSQSFTNPVVFAQPLSSADAESALVRITDVQSDSFTLYVQETSDLDGAHAAETVSYVVLEAGSWELDDGTLLEVGRVATVATVGRLIDNHWENVTLSQSFVSTPVTISQVQSASDARFVSTRQQNGNPGGFEVALEGEETASTSHGTEVVGWLAIEAKSGVWSGHRYEANYTAEGVGNNWTTNAFDQGFLQAPRFIAGLAGYAEDDSAHLRYQALESACVKIMVQEDKSEDKEMNHSGEIVSYLVLEGDGLLTVMMIILPTPAPTPTP